MSSSKVLIFTKNAIEGDVKTRIGNEKGHEIAVKIYRKLLLHTRDVAQLLDCTRKVYFNREIEKEGIWDNRYFEKSLQAEGDLGVKMGTAFSQELTQDSLVILIGSDCGTLSVDHLKTAFQLLKYTDIVLGPALDGGYYLIGMKKYHDYLFKEMPWSRESLLRETIDKILKQGNTFSTLPSLSDIDYWEDWKNLGWSMD